MSSETVDHPDHYNHGKYECIDVAEEIGLTKCSHLFNAFKYIWRCGDKHTSPVEDIEKAIWYLQYKLEKIKEQE